MVRSIKLLLCFTLAIPFTLASSNEESERKENVDQDIIVNLLNETKWTFIQHSHASTEDVAEMKSILRQLWQERQDEMHRKREEESNIIRHLQQEVRELREESRENMRMLREESRDDLHQFHSALDNVVTLQGLVIEMRERETHQQQQLQQHQLDLLALNTSITAQRLEAEMQHEIREREGQQHQLDLHALNTSITVQGRESELARQMDINQLEESMSAMNDSFSSYSVVVEAQEELLQQCRNETQTTSQALAAQELWLDHHLEAINSHTRRKVVHNNGLPSKCSGIKVLHATEGSIEVSSSDYVNNMDCSWRIVTPHDSSVNFTWSYFATEPCCDYLLVKNANGREMRRLGGSPSLSNLVVDTNEVELIFHTDGSANAASNSNYRGFHVNYEALWKSQYSFT